MLKRWMEPAVAWMDRLPFKMKILTSVSILFILLIMPSRTTFVNYLHQNEIYDRQMSGITYIVKIQKLIHALQLHRGLTNAYLGGSKRFKARILTIQKKIQKDFDALYRFDTRGKRLLRFNEHFVDALSHLPLITFTSKTSARNSQKLFDLHSRIIDDLMHTILDISKKSDLTNGSDLAVNHIAELLQEKLPRLQEESGLLRGLAAGIFSRKQLTPTLKERILTHYMLIKSLENSLTQNHLLSRLPDFITIQKETTFVLYRLDALLDIVYRHLIAADDPKYDAPRFFSLATDTIDAQTKLFDTLARSYRHHITQMRRMTDRTLLWLLGGFLVIVIGALFLSTLFYRSIVSSLEKLQHATELIAAGETKIRIETKANDEIGSALRSFNHMSRKLGKTLSFLDSYKKAIDESSIVSKTTPKGIITYANDKFCEISGYTRKELIGKPHNIVRHPDMPAAVFEEMWHTILNKRVWKGVITNRKKNGESYTVDATILPIVDADGKIVEFVAIRHDITELERSREEIQKQKIDPLTGLSTQNRLIEDLKRAPAPLLMYLNINDFSAINDFYGMKIADRLLIYLARIFESYFEDKECRIYKYHNDDFFLLFDARITPPEKAQTLMKETLEYIEHKTIECDEQSCVSITMRGGIAYHSQAQRNEELVTMALLASKEAKKRNKTFLLYDSEMDRERDYRNNIEWIHKLKDAIEHDRLLPYFQPIVDTRSGAITKYEALVRLIDAQGTLYSPYHFLEIAQKAKLYTHITKIILERTCAQIERTPQFDFSINLTVEDILDEEICAFIFDKLERFAHPNRLIFEITESQQITDYQPVLRFMERVRLYGVQIAIDDFGSGYANFDHIVNLKPDFIKIDGSLIREIDTNNEAAIITEAIIAFSKKLRAKTVVEFVHSEAIYQKILSLNADFAQGYYLGEPAAQIVSLTDMLEEERTASTHS